MRIGEKADVPGQQLGDAIDGVANRKRLVTAAVIFA
jgi:hypothetical protein